MSDTVAPADRLVLGTFQFRKMGEREIRATLDAFFDAGGTWLDTAGFYGRGEVERQVGRCLAADRPAARITAKVGYLRHPSEYRDEDALRAELERSMERLGVVPDVVQVHEADWRVWWSGSAPEWEIIGPGDAVERDAPVWTLLAGMASRLGFRVGIAGNHAPQLLLAAGKLAPQLVQVAKQYDLLWRTADPLLDWAGGAGAEVWCAAPFHQGRLFALEDLARAGGGLGAAAGRLERLLSEHRTDVARTAIPYLAADPRVGRVVAGLSSPEEVRSALSALEAGIAQELCAAIRALGVDAPPGPPGEPVHRAVA
jgi:aryl-alcohol dehydrogenase-like predicted oxidoreductase